MIIFPAIDLRNGRVVRLQQGRMDAETVYSDDPVEPARAFKDAGAEWIHVVDLDGAFTGEQRNLDAVRAIQSVGLKVELGGGLRSVEAVRRVLDSGVSRAVVGTRAATDDGFIRQLLETVAPEQLAVGIDAKDGMVAVKGWVETVDHSAVDLALKMQDLGVQTLIYTDISRDGMLTGPNFEGQIAMLDALEIDVVASGGVASASDISRFREIAAEHPNLQGVILGKALYDGRVALKEIL